MYTELLVPLDDIDVRARLRLVAPDAADPRPLAFERASVFTGACLQIGELRAKGGDFVWSGALGWTSAAIAPLRLKRFDKVGSAIGGGARETRFTRQICNGEPAICARGAAREEPFHGFAQGLLRSTHGHGDASSISELIRRRLRAISSRSARRCSADKRLSLRSASPSAIEACQGGKWRRVIQALGQRSGLQWDRIGAPRSAAFVRSRQSAVAGSKKQSFRRPT